MKINFYLKEPKSTKESLILVTISLNGKRSKFSTTQKINPKYWNVNTQRIKTNAPDALNFNKILNTVHSKILDLYTKNYIENDKSKTTKFFDEVRRYLSGKFENSEIELTVDEAFEKFLELRANVLNAETIKAYKTLRNHLKSYSLYIRNELLFEDLNLNFYDGFVKYLRFICKQKINTWSRHIKNLKSFMQYTLDRKYHSNTEFKQFKREHEKGQFVYFSEEDFNRVFNLDLSHNKSLDRSRRLFCISCLTGLRFSDVININFTNIKDRKYHLGVVKKNAPMKIKMTDRAITYIKEYFDLYGIGGGFTSQTTNKHLTKILMLAEVDREELLFEKNYLGVLEEIRKPMYEWITFHYGRRYFIIKCLERGMQPLQIMEITGHEDFSVFQAYVKFSEADSLDKLNMAWD
ncbi:tyrosine-type recombinase/integrase [uncultured Chryseobacterium sp.]|uniref:tyrosine-type recombinase/integrase n=1 Tax=uncultured Chryseobacterium sp. TaxID=259322 RepID=UPI0025F8B23E|nr:tyrosine-type recombinase/integrase [uncultured Chryseobacterium sp.]